MNASTSTSKRRAKGSGGLSQGPAGVWIGRYRDHRGKRRSRSTGTTRRQAAERILADWIAQDRLVRAGLAEADDAPRHRPIAEALDGFCAAKRSEARTERHIDETRKMIERAAEASRWATLDDIDAEGLEAYIGRRRAPADGSRAWSPKRAHNVITAIRSFTRWCVADGRLPADPLARVKKPTPHRQRVRRALTVDEWSWLKAATEAGPERLGMPGPERRLLYAVALETGYRNSELRALRRTDLQLDGDRPSVMLSGSHTKNGKASRQYVRPALAAELREHAAAMMPGAAVFRMPHRAECARMLRADLADARRRWIDAAADDASERIRREGSDFLRAEDHDGRVLDFHALRHTCGAWAAMGGASPKAVQTLMRHSTITLTLDTYGHLLPDEAAQTVARMPEAEPIALRLTGTDDEPEGVRSPDEGPASNATNAHTNRCQSVRRDATQTALTPPKPRAGVAESADAADSKSAGVTPVGVRVPPPALSHRSPRRARPYTSPGPRVRPWCCRVGGGAPSLATACAPRSATRGCRSPERPCGARRLGPGSVAGRWCRTRRRAGLRRTRARSTRSRRR